MPIYEYRCSKCGHELEALQKLSEAPLTACPACREATLVKQMSAAGFHLKGSGWYATDFRGSKAGKPADSDEAAKAGAKTDAKTDAKPAADSPVETKSDTKGASNTSPAATKAAPVPDAG
jgi:putative FmdB family regulatory protein